MLNWTSLSGSNLFMPHGHCYLWKPELVGLHILSDALIALAYYSIPLTLFYFVRRRSDLPFIWIFWLFSAFIVACGTTHLLEIWTLWYPTYWLSGSVKLLTAMVSVTTAVLLVPIVPQALALPSPTALALANEALQQEVAERTRIEAELRRNRDLREAIFNESADALFLVDAQTLFTLDCNQRAVDLFQAVDKTHLLGIEGHMLQRYQFSQDELQEIGAEMQAKGFWSREIEYVTCQGNIFWGNLAVKPITVAERVMHLVRVTDITDRKRAEHALQEREAFLRAIGDNIPNGYLYQLRREPDGRYHYTYVSAGIERVSGLKPDAVLADSSLMFKLVVEEDLPAVLQKGEESAQNLSVFDLQVREQLPNGKTRWLRLCSMPRRLDNGTIVWDGMRLDIDDLKQTEEALRQSEVRNRALIQAIPDLLIRMKQDGTYLDIQTTGNVLPYNASRMVIGNNIHAILPADKAQERMQYVQQALQTRALQVYEYQLRLDGNLQFEEARIIPCGEDEVLVIVRNISDRKQTEEALRRYERIVSATTDAISLIDRNYVYQVVNQTYVNWYNKPQDEIVGHSVSELLPMNVYETTIKPRLDQCLAGQVVQYEMWADYATLKPQFLSVTYNPYFDNAYQAVSGVVVSLRNITRLKQAEVELELQSLIVRNMAEGVCMVKSADDTIVYANPKFERMFGYDAGELKGKHISIVNYADAEATPVAAHQAIATTILQQGEATYEVHNVKKDGTPFWGQGIASLFEHPTYGTVLVAVHQDVTERKQAEAVIQASLKEKEVLLKEIHHRVKNNLGIVDGLLQMQSRRSSDPQVIATLKESQNRIASIALVHEKLYGSKDLANIDFAQYIADLTAHLFDSYNTRANQIKLMTQIEPIALNIDTAIPCGLIINELVSNALKYAFPKKRAGEIQVLFQQHPDQRLTLCVRDNGIGLPQDFNLKQTKALGITLVKGLVKQLRGTLEISSQQGVIISISFTRT